MLTRRIKLKEYKPSEDSTLNCFGNLSNQNTKSHNLHLTILLYVY